MNSDFKRPGWLSWAVTAQACPASQASRKAFPTCIAWEAVTLFGKGGISQPLVEDHDPVADRFRIVCAHTETMPARGIDVELGRDAGLFELEVNIGETFRDIRAIIIRAGQEGGR